MPIPKLKDRNTVHDYMTWPDEERWEIIDGFVYDMSPAPSLYHQTVSVNLTSILRTALRGKTCRVFSAPTDVVLSDYDVVQPDVLVVCDPKKMTERNIQGAPDLIIEILSPSTSTKDQREKFYLYEKFGVHEYLIIEPDAKHVRRFALGDDELFDRGEIFDAQQILALKSLEDIEIPLWDIFEVEKISEKASDTSE